MDSKNVKYYYKDANGQTQGPFFETELKKLNLPNNTLLWKKGMEDWTELYKVCPKLIKSDNSELGCAIIVCCVIIIIATIAAVLTLGDYDSNKSSHNKEYIQNSKDQSEFVYKFFGRYSIGFPNNWESKELPYGDVYMGSTTDRIGMSIIYNDNPGISLNEVVRRSTEGMRGMKYSVLCSDTIINGYRAKKQIVEGRDSFGGFKRHVYNINANDVLYTITFGNDPNKVDENLDLFNRILSSFHILSKEEN